VTHGSTLHFIADTPHSSDAVASGFEAFDLGGPIEIDGTIARFERVEGGLAASLVPNMAMRALIERLRVEGSRQTGAREPRFYDRISKKAQPSDLPGLNRLKKLATALDAVNADASMIRLPALYTYLGQIVAHDLTRSEAGSDLSNPVNLRTHALDFDSLFGPVDGNLVPIEPLLGGGGLCLGSTTLPGRFRDLPRNAEGVACIADSRNDHNLVLAQLVVMLIRFHHCVGVLCNPPDLEAHKQITRRHLQSIVLHEYANHLVDRDIIQDVLASGRAVVRPNTTAEPFRVSIEFAAAIFRFGHSMVRPVYDLNIRERAKILGEIFDNTEPGGAINSNLPRLRDDWAIDWDVFQAQDGGILQEAEPVDHRLTGQLSEIPKWMVREPPSGVDLKKYSLAEITLLRGQSVSLRSAQSVLRDVADAVAARPVPHGNPLPPVVSALDPAQIASVGHGELADLLEDDSQGPPFASQTPLWLYTLCEAAIAPGRGGALGPLAGRVVYETLHAAVQACPGSIVTDAGTFEFFVHPSLRHQSADTFSFSDLFAVVRQCEADGTIGH